MPCGIILVDGFGVLSSPGSLSWSTDATMPVSKPRSVRLFAFITAKASASSPQTAR